MAQFTSKIAQKRRNIGGTPHWMAPEQLEPLHAVPSTASDVYAFGGLVYIYIFFFHFHKKYN